MKKLPIVFSASRLVDLAMWYPQVIIDSFNDAITRYQCHTLMVWTKFPGALLREPLRSFLISIQQQGVQVCLQLTITGMGGTEIEPRVPKWEDSVAKLPGVIALIGDARRIKLRIDPQLRYFDSAGVEHSNYDLFELIMAACAQLGIQDFATSFVENHQHKRVAARFQKLGYTLNAPDATERREIAERLKEMAGKYGVNISACAVPGLPTSHCLNADRLEELHPTGLKLEHRKKTKLGRELCGCCMDVNLGGWPPKKCPSGCKYCYANPEV